MNDAVEMALPDWARAAGRPSATARIRAEAEDFEVTEILGFDPDDDGEHDYLYVEKRGLNTAEVAAGLARYAGIPRRDVGFAGMKDRRAVTMQWFSVRRPGGRDIDWPAFAGDSIRIRQYRRHRRKLKRGAHAGNRFRLILRELDDPGGSLEHRLTRLCSTGVPNYFGEQRFGRGGRNVSLARTMFAGARLPRGQRSIALSAARSLIFNELTSARVVAGTWDRLLEGDVAGLDGSGSVFVVEAPDDDLARRLESMDLHPTGPLWGSGVMMSRGVVAEAECAAAAEHAELRDGLEAAARASRRHLRTVVRDLEWQRDGDRITLCFALDRGAFATAVLRELVTYRQ